MRRQCKTLALTRPYTASMVRGGGHRKPPSMAERADGGGRGLGWARAGRGGVVKDATRYDAATVAAPIPCLASSSHWRAPPAPLSSAWRSYSSAGHEWGKGFIDNAPRAARALAGPPHCRAPAAGRHAHLKSAGPRPLTVGLRPTLVGVIQRRSVSPSGKEGCSPCGMDGGDVIECDAAATWG